MYLYVHEFTQKFFILSCLYTCRETQEFFLLSLRGESDHSTKEAPSVGSSYINDLETLLTERNNWAQEWHKN